MVRFFFDFISPYSYVATQLISRHYGHLPLHYEPVIFGTMLSRRGVKGPGEIPARRRIGLQDLILLCAQHNLPLQGPPRHPFNSIYALRSVCNVEDDATRAELTQRFFRATWAEGRDLEDLTVLRNCIEATGLDFDPEEAATSRENRQTLKRSTKDALEAGAWGVPTFLTDDLVFFGHDRLDLLDKYLSGQVALDKTKLAELLARPQPGRVT